MHCSTTGRLGTYLMMVRGQVIVTFPLTWEKNVWLDRDTDISFQYEVSPVLFFLFREPKKFFVVLFTAVP